MQRNVSKIDPKLNLGLHELANLSTGDGSLLTIPFTKMRKRYRDLQGLNTAEQLKEAQAALAADIAEDFAKSVQAFEPYKNFQPFYSIRRPPLKTPVDITRTEDFASVLKDQAGGQIQSDPSLGFQYVERELVPARTTGLSRYSNGESKRRIIRFDLLLVLNCID